jgi:hypothetical protein
MTERITLFFPYNKDWLDPSQFDKGCPEMTDFISWLLTYVGHGNYNIYLSQDRNGNPAGWPITFNKARDAVLFKLVWL